MDKKPWKTFNEFKRMIDRVVEENERRIWKAQLQPVKKKGLESVPKAPFTFTHSEGE